MALLLDGVLAEGEEAQPETVVDGMDVLNAMLSSWILDNLIVPFIDKGSYSLPVKQEVTVGPGCDIVMTNPSSITSIVITDSGLRYDTAAMPDVHIQSYYPFQQGTPSKYCFVPGVLSGVIMFDSIPSTGSVAEIRSQKPFTEITELTEETFFPPGYEMAIYYGIAVLIAPKYGKRVDQAVASIAAESYNRIKAYNATVRPPAIISSDAGTRTRPSLVWGGLRW